ncbi:MAG: cell division protein FtsI, partial [Alistipes sp.]|nr:cell division protein FtsI [Alistipes sp.]
MAKKKGDNDIRSDMFFRAKIMYIVFFLIAMCVVGRLVWVMLPSGETAYNAARLENRIFLRDTIISRRGAILARDGEPLATSILRYRIDFDMGSEGFDDDEVFRENADSLSKLLAEFFGDRSSAEYRRRLLSERERNFKTVYSHDSIVKRSSDLITLL